MSKKRNRQPDANPDASEGSTESCDESSTGENCPHVARAVNLSKIKKNIKKGGIGLECMSCKKSKDGSLVSPNAKENEEEETQSGIWICLQCGNQGCGREKNGHAIEHSKKSFSDCHLLVADTLQWTVWCYQCEIEINASSRKKLLETVMFVKKLASMPSPTANAALSQETRNTREPAQNGTNDLPQSSTKPILELPKVMGLTNLGNTCFFNAVLQCLAQTPFLLKVLEDLRLPGQKFVLPGGKHKPFNSSEDTELPPIEGTLEGWGGFTSILYKTLAEMQNTKGHQTYTPSELLNSFKKKTMQCMDGGQHDSHELLRHLLEIVRNEDLRRYQSVILKEVGLNEKTNPEAVDNTLKSRVRFYGNQASARLLGPELIFRGVLVSTLECLDCHHISTSTEPFLDLSLPVMADKPQPPYFKRKSTPHEDTVEAKTDEATQKAAKRRTKMVNHRGARKGSDQKSEKVEAASNSETTPDDNLLLEVISEILEADERDADVEDNAEVESLLPEAGVFECSSQKASALATPISRSSSQTTAKSDVIPNGVTVYRKSDPNASDSNSNAVVSSSAKRIEELLEACLARTNISADPMGSSESPDNEALTHSGSLGTSLAVHSDLTSPDWPTASLSSFASPEKDSPSPNSPCSALSPISPVNRFNSAPNAPEPCNSCRPSDANDACHCDEHRTNDDTSEQATDGIPMGPLTYDDYFASITDRSPVMSMPPPSRPPIENFFRSHGAENGNESSSMVIPLPAPPSMDEFYNPYIAENGNREQEDDDEEDSFERKLRKEEKETEKKVENGGDTDDEDSTGKTMTATERHAAPCRKREGDGPKCKRSTAACNGSNGSASKMQSDTNVQQSPTRYPTKEGECSIQSCLNQFTALELMSGSNKVGCPACTARERKAKEGCKMVCTPSTKQYLISQVPAVLILHLKRCQAQRFDFRKVTKHVSFPILLDLAPVCKGHKKSRIYALYGVVEHSGTMHGGHYVAYVKTRVPLSPDDPRWSFLPSKEPTDREEGSNSAASTPTSGTDSCSPSDSEAEESSTANAATNVELPAGKWYHISDSRVSEVDERTVLQSQAYLLFYERIL